MRMKKADDRAASINSRQSNFELLRIIAMFLIVSMHLTSQNGLDSLSIGGCNWVFTEFISSFGRISVNLFLMIGTWFLVDAEFSAKRILKLYSELWFYCVAGTVVMIVIGKTISIQDLINGILPLLSGSCWFVPVYIELLMVAPFLKKILGWKKTRLGLFIALLFCFSCIVSTIHKFSEDYFSWFMWFCCMYLFMGFYKKYISAGFSKKFNKYMALAIALLLYCLMVYFKSDGIQQLETHMGMLGKLTDQYLADCKSLPNFVIAALIFYFFQNIDLGSNKIINRLSRSTLAVYLIHQSPNFILYLWNGCLRVEIWKTSSFYILFFLLSIIVIFVASYVIDSIRLNLIEPLWVKSRFFKKIERILTNIYAKAFDTLTID